MQVRQRSSKAQGVRYNDRMDPEVSCCAWTVMVGQWSGWGSQVETLVGRTRRALAVPGQRYEEG